MWLPSKAGFCPPAEKDQVKWHPPAFGASPFDKVSGASLAVPNPRQTRQTPSTRIFLPIPLIHLAENDRRIVGITAASAQWYGLLKMMKLMP